MATHRINPFGHQTGVFKAEDLPGETKKWVAEELLAKRKTPLQMMASYGLKPDTIGRWVTKLRKGIPIYKSKGRPACMDVEEEKKYVSKLSNNRYQARVEDSFKFFQEAVDATAEKRGTQSTTPCSKTVKKYDRRNNVKVHNAETTTDARATACADITNFVTFAAMNWLFVEKRKIPPHLILNIDATQYQVGSDTSANVAVKSATAIEGCVKAAYKKGDNTSGVAYFIKHFLLMNAFGDVMDPVFVVADERMKPDAFHAYLIPGLGVGTQIGAPAWLVFCKTRCGNVPFFRWLNETLIIPAVEELRRAYKLPCQEAWFQLDGEAKQIECYDDLLMIELMARALISIGKPPASTTEVTQPCDAGDGFKGDKAALEYTRYDVS